MAWTDDAADSGDALRVIGAGARVGFRGDDWERGTWTSGVDSLRFRDRRLECDCDDMDDGTFWMGMP